MRVLRRGRGAVVTVSSTASYLPKPLVTVYGATKVFYRCFRLMWWFSLCKTGWRDRCPVCSRYSWSLEEHCVRQECQFPQIFDANYFGDALKVMLCVYLCCSDIYATWCVVWRTSTVTAGWHFSVCPSYVATRMTQYSTTLSNPSLFIPTATTYARHALSTLGWTHQTTGYLPHTAVVMLLMLLVLICKISEGI